MNREQKENEIVDYAAKHNIHFPKENLTAKTSEHIDFIHGCIKDENFNKILPMKERQKCLLSFIDSKNVESLVFNSFMELMSKVAPISKEDLSDAAKQVKKQQQIKEQIKGIPTMDKIKGLLHIAELLGFDVKGSTAYFDRIHDIANTNKPWLDEVFSVMQVLMEDEHYKVCSCTAKKFEIMLFSNSHDETKDKMFKENLIGGI